MVSHQDVEQLSLAGLDPPPLARALRIQLLERRAGAGLGELNTAKRRRNNGFHLPCVAMKRFGGTRGSANPNRKSLFQNGFLNTARTPWSPRGRPPAPSGSSFEMINNFHGPDDCRKKKNDAYIEQQISAEVAPGIIGIFNPRWLSTGMGRVTANPNGHGRALIEGGGPRFTWACSAIRAWRARWPKPHSPHSLELRFNSLGAKGAGSYAENHRKRFGNSFSSKFTKTSSVRKKGRVVFKISRAGARSAPNGGAFVPNGSNDFFFFLVFYYVALIFHAHKN